MNIQWIGSTNYDIGRGGNKVNLIVVHHMAGTIAATDAVFQDDNRNTSAHYGVGRNGEIHQYVKEGDTAFAVGNYSVNQRSISIEHEDLNADNYTDLEYETSAALIRDICDRYGLPIDHNTIQPHRNFTATACPGTLDIDRLINLAQGEDDVANTFTNPVNGDKRDAQGWYNAYAERDAQWNHDERDVIPGLAAQIKSQTSTIDGLNNQVKDLESKLQEAISKLPTSPETPTGSATTSLDNYSIGDLLISAFKKTLAKLRLIK